MSDLEPVSTSALYVDEIERLKADSRCFSQRIADLEAVVARQARQITEQSVRMASLTRKLAAVTAENGRLKAGQPRPSGHRGYTQRLGAP